MIYRFPLWLGQVLVSGLDKLLFRCVQQKKLSRFQAVVCGSWPANGVEGGTAQASESAAAVATQHTCPQLGKRLAARKPKLQAFKRLLDGYKDATGGAMVAVGPRTLAAMGSHGLSVMDALRMQQPQNEHARSVTGREHSRISDTKRVAAACKRKLHGAWPAPSVGNPPPYSNYHVNEYSTSEHKVNRRLLLCYACVLEDASDLATAPA